MRPIVVAPARPTNLHSGVGLVAKSHNGIIHQPSSSDAPHTVTSSTGTTDSVRGSAKQALEAMGSCRRVLEMASRGNELSEADADNLEDVLTTLTSALSSMVDTIRQNQSQSPRHHCAPSHDEPAAPSLPIKAVASDTGSLHMEQPVEFIPAATGDVVRDPLREQPLDWFEMRRRGSQVMSPSTEQPPPTVEPAMDKAAAPRGDDAMAAAAAAVPAVSRWRAVQAATVSTLPAPTLANTVVDAMSVQHSHSVSVREADMRRAAEEAERRRDALEAEHESSRLKACMSPMTPTNQSMAPLSPVEIDSLLTESYGIDKVLLEKPADEHWKTTIKLKRAREEAARLRAQVAAQAAEKAEWEGVPAWKRALLEQRRKKKEEEEAPRLAALRAEQEAQARFAALPAWKQQLLIKKQGGQ
eukprot:m.90633 g.90633  ORF g.90633 m.90633 type:complete len:414 (+) comp9871_c0_seq1:48-1289(+)